MFLDVFFSQECGVVILFRYQSERLSSLTTSALAKTMGRPKAEITMPVVRKMASSLQALLAESVSSTTLREMQYGMGERM